MFCGWVITMNDSHLHLFPSCYWAFQNWHKNSFLTLKHRSFISAVLWHCLEYVSVFTMFADATCLCCPSALNRAANDSWEVSPALQILSDCSYCFFWHKGLMHPWGFNRRTMMVSVCTGMQWCSHGRGWGVLQLERPAGRQGSFSQAQLGGKCGFWLPNQSWPREWVHRDGFCQDNTLDTARAWLKEVMNLWYLIPS